MTTAIAKLKELAVAATEGPWESQHFLKNKKWHGADITAPKKSITYTIKTFEGEIFEKTDPFYIAGNYDYEEGGICSKREDADFISAANPEQILRIIEAIELMEGALEYYAPLVHSHKDGSEQLHYYIDKGIRAKEALEKVRGLLE